MDQKMNSFILSHLLQINFQLEVCMYYKYMELCIQTFFQRFSIVMSKINL